MKEPTRTIILEEPSSFQFFSMPDGQHYLSVLCGTIGLYNVCFPLNEAELNGYREFGDCYIEKLSVKVCRNPESYKARTVKL